MFENTHICNMGMLLPAIGLGLSALALLAALWLSLRMMTLETRQLVAQEIDEIKAQHVSFDPDTQEIDGPVRNGHRRILGRYRFVLLVPSLLLMLGSSALLYMNSSKDCNIVDQGADGDTGDDS